MLSSSPVLHCCPGLPFLHWLHQHHDSCIHSQMCMKRPRPQDRQGWIPKHPTILRHILNFLDMVSNCLAGSWPKGVQSGALTVIHLKSRLSIWLGSIDFPQIFWLWQVGHWKGVQRWSPGWACLKQILSSSSANNAPLKSLGVLTSKQSREWAVKQEAHQAASQAGKWPWGHIMPDSKVTWFWYLRQGATKLHHSCPFLFDLPRKRARRGENLEKKFQPLMVWMQTEVKMNHYAD